MGQADILRGGGTAAVLTVRWDLGPMVPAFKVCSGASLGRLNRARGDSGWAMRRLCRGAGIEPGYITESNKCPHTGFKSMPASFLPFSSKASTVWSLTYSVPPSLEEMANENLSCSHQRG